MKTYTLIINKSTLLDWWFGDDEVSFNYAIKVKKALANYGRFEITAKDIVMDAGYLPRSVVRNIDSIPDTFKNADKDEIMGTIRHLVDKGYLKIKFEQESEE